MTWEAVSALEKYQADDGDRQWWGSSNSGFVSGVSMPFIRGERRWGHHPEEGGSSEPQGRPGIPGEPEGNSGQGRWCPAVAHTQVPKLPPVLPMRMLTLAQRLSPEASRCVDSWLCWWSWSVDNQYLISLAFPTRVSKGCHCSMNEKKNFRNKWSSLIHLYFLNGDTKIS